MISPRRIFALLLVAVLTSLTSMTYANINDLTISPSASPDSVVLRWSVDPINPYGTSYNIYRSTTFPVNTNGLPYDQVSVREYRDYVPGGVVKYFYAVTSAYLGGCLYGNITATNGGPVAGARVCVDTLCTYAGYNGEYVLCGLTAGPVTVNVSVACDAPQSFSATVDLLNPVQANFQLTATPIVQKTGHITTSETWTSNNIYQLVGQVTVDAPNTLTIEAGTRIIGSYPQLGTLIISRGAQINAVGTPTNPIVFTSNRPCGQRANGDWGGVVINGNAQNNRGTVPNGEGDSGPFGRPDTLFNNENSGIMRYVRLEFPGFRFTPINELNGLCLQGVGRGTTIDHIQVQKGQDDCVEFFGGTVNTSYLVLSSGGDDGFDWTDGWQGTAHHVLIHQRDATSDRGIEADNLEQDFTALPRSQGNLSNFTIIGKKGVAAPDGDDLVTFRRGTEFRLYNSIITLAKRDALDIDDSETSINGALSPTVPNPNRVAVDYCLFWNNGTVETIDPNTGPGIGDLHFEVNSDEYDNTNCQPRAEFPIQSIHVAAPVGWTQSHTQNSRASGCGWVGNNATNRVVNPQLVNPGGYPIFDAHAPAGSPVYTGAAPSLPGGLPVVPYLGCYSSPTDNWTDGWTNFVVN